MELEWLLAVAALLAGWPAWRAWVASRPLALGPSVIRQEVHGDALLRVRVRLGHGRAVSRYQVSARWVGEDGATEALRVDDPPGCRVGAWTVSLAAPTASRGALVVGVVAWEGARRWEAEARWPAEAVRAGRFVPVVEGGPGRWRWSARWAEVDAAEPPSAG